MEKYFEPMHISKIDQGYTRLVGFIPDQAILFGILSRIRDINIELVEIHQIVGDGTSLDDSIGLK